MEKYIYTYDSDLDSNFLNEIIDISNLENEKNPLSPLYISFLCATENYRNDKHFLWNKFKLKLKSIIDAQMQNYLQAINIYNSDFDNTYIHFEDQSILKKDLIFLKFNAESLPSFEFTDFYISSLFENKLTFIFFLNDEFDGGEIEFINGYKITPKVGRMVLFPASWTFIYKHNSFTGKISKQIVMGNLVFSNNYFK